MKILQERISFIFSKNYHILLNTEILKLERTNKDFFLFLDNFYNKLFYSHIEFQDFTYLKYVKK